MILLKGNGGYVFIVSLVKAVMLTLIVSCLNSSSVVAQSPGSESVSQTEQWLRQQIKVGEIVNLEGKEVGGLFLADLLRDAAKQGGVPAYGVHISNAVISGDLDLYEVTIPFMTRLEDCVFKGAVNFTRSEFQKSLSIRGSTFEGVSNFYEMSVDGNFRANKAKFLTNGQQINFDSINVSGTVYFYETIFEGPFILRDSVMHRLDCANTKFRNNDAKAREENANFVRVKVNTDAFFSRASFEGLATFENIDVAKDFEFTDAHFNNPSETIKFFSMKVGGNAIFNEAKFSGGFDMTKADIAGNLEFSGTQAPKTGSPKNFTGMRADAAIFDNAALASPYWLTGAVYRLIIADSEEGLKTLIDRSEYSPDAYTSLEAYFRRMGLDEAADDVYIAGSVRERDENFRKRGFTYLPQYLWSSFLYITVGYGKHLTRALLWSVITIVVGWLGFFRKEKYMMLQKKEDEARYKGTYSPLWYSIALFLPIVNLEDAQIWAPKIDRTKSRVYMRLHIILGYLLIPLGLAAWTGLIK
jgi:uncharacterized protein YjbI with pentapeptide repeats